MNTTTYPENTPNRTIVGQIAKSGLLLVISLGLYLFSIDFPFYTVFEPQSTGWVLWASYANDFIQPVAFYFFLCLGERWLRTWQSRALVAFAIPVGLEIVQALYYLLPGVHRYIGSFDILDIIIYGLGVGLAVLIEQKIFAQSIKFW